MHVLDQIYLIKNTNYYRDYVTSKLSIRKIKVEEKLFNRVVFTFYLSKHPTKVIDNLFVPLLVLLD